MGLLYTSKTSKAKFLQWRFKFRYWC